MEDIQLEVQINTWDNSSVWVNQDTLETSSIFVREGCLYHAFTNVGTSEDWGRLSQKKTKGLTTNMTGVLLPFLNSYSFL